MSGIRQHEIHHFLLDTSVVEYVKLCTVFEGKSVCDLNDWYLEAPETVMNLLITSAYSPQCRFLLDLGDCNDLLKFEPRVLMGSLFNHLYSTFFAADKSIFLPPLGLWLYFRTIGKESLPANFWTEVFGGVVPSDEISLALPRGPCSEDRGEKECKCAIYNLTAAHRGQNLRVGVGWTSDDDDARLLVQIKLE